jgi:hypothetical protein
MDSLPWDAAGLGPLDFAEQLLIFTEEEPESAAEDAARLNNERLEFQRLQVCRRWCISYLCCCYYLLWLAGSALVVLPNQQTHSDTRAASWRIVQSCVKRRSLKPFIGFWMPCPQERDDSSGSGPTNSPPSGMALSGSKRSGTDIDDEKDSKIPKEDAYFEFTLNKACREKARRSRLNDRCSSYTLCGAVIRDVQWRRLC